VVRVRSANEPNVLHIPAIGRDGGVKKNEREGAMQDISNKRQPKKSPERSQTPLWFAVAGLAIVLLSRGMKDEMIGDVVAWFGGACSVVAMLYWAVRPKHGMR
jgi:hypothetical protein